MSDLLIPRNDFESTKFKDRNDTFTKNYASESFKANSDRFAINLRKSSRSYNTAKRRAILGPLKYPSIFMQNYRGKINISELPVALIKSYPELASDEVPAIEKLGIIRRILYDEKVTELIIESLNALMGIFGSVDTMPIEIIFRMEFIPVFIKYME